MIVLPAGAIAKELKAIVAAAARRPRTPGMPAAPGVPENPPAGQVVIRQTGGVEVRGTVGDATPKVSAGGGGWQSVPRDGRVALQWWNGREAAAVTFPIVFSADDGIADSVALRAVTLERMWGVGLPDDQAPPPVRFNSTAVVPLDVRDARATDWLWTVAACEESDGTRRDWQGQRVYATYTVTLQRIVADTQLISEAAARRAASAVNHGEAQAAHKYHDVKRGETLVKIASVEYGDVDRWIDIAKANGLHHPHDPLPDGKRLRLP